MPFPIRLLTLFAVVLSVESVEAVRGRPPSGYRPPVIEKVQIVFSMVSHYNHIGDRVNFYNTRGIPEGNSNYAVPHLVYEPLITLYNPYPDPLVLPQVRVRIWDPPVGFRFKKNEHYLRSHWTVGDFDGLAQLQIANELNPSARKSFTLLLRETSANGMPGDPVTLQPGESRVFSAWTEPQWTWALETGGGYSPRSFFDWSALEDFTNVDNRTNNLMGVEAVPGLEYRSGFQTDGLSLSFNRPASTRYDFELANNYSGNWVAIKLTDTVAVECRAMRRVDSSREPDFRVSLLGGYVVDPERDNYQELSFSVAPLVQPPPVSDSNATVARVFQVGDLLQAPNDVTPGGKTPFAVLTVAAKNRSVLDGSLTELADLDGNDHFDLRFDPVAGFESITEIGNFETVPAVVEPTVLGMVRDGDELKIDFVVPSGSQNLRVMGGTSPESFPDDLSAVSTIIPAPYEPSPFNRKTASIDLTGLGPNYFLRIEEMQE